MPVEGANFIRELTPATPGGGAPVSEGDNELTQLKDVFVNQFSGLRADTSNIPVTVGAETMNGIADKNDDLEVIPGTWEFSATCKFSSNRPILFDHAGDIRLEFDGGTGFDIEFLNKNQTSDFIFYTSDDPGQAVLRLESNGDVGVERGDLNVTAGDVNITAGDLTVSGTFSPTAVSANTVEGTQYLETGGNLRVPLRSDSTDVSPNIRRIRVDDPSGNLLGFIRLFDGT